MNANRSLFGLSLLLLLLSGCTPEVDEFAGEPLPACSVQGTPFEDEDFAEYKKEGDPPEYGKWKKLYEKHLKAVLAAEELALLGRESKEEEPADQPKLKCDEETYVKMLPASKPVKDLAKELEQFKDKADKLSALDTNAVILEWLRTYECALRDQTRNADKNIRAEFKKHAPKNLTIPAVNREATRRNSYIENELQSSREVTDNLTTLLGGFTRLRVLNAELACLERASADIRNNISLLSEASACLPRALDVKTSPRDFSLDKE